MPRASGAGQATEIGASEAGENPGFVRMRAEAAVKLGRRGVPIEDDPLHLLAAFSDGGAREGGHEGFAGALAALLRQHKMSSIKSTGVQPKVEYAK